MYEYLKRNKEWIFSGIGVAVIIAGITVVRLAFFDSHNKSAITENSYKQEILEEQPQSTIINGESEKPAKRSPVTIDEFNAMLKNETITELQRQEFIKKHTGRIIKWEGIVVNVKPLFSNDEETEIMVVYMPVSKANNNLPDLLTAAFPHTAKSDLAALAEGDLIEFEGKLEILSTGDSRYPSARDCVLLRYEKRGIKTP